MPQASPSKLEYVLNPIYPSKGKTMKKLNKLNTIQERNNTHKKHGIMFMIQNLKKKYAINLHPENDTQNRLHVLSLVECYSHELWFWKIYKRYKNRGFCPYCLVFYFRTIASNNIDTNSDLCKFIFPMKTKILHVIIS